MFRLGDIETVEQVEIELRNPRTGAPLGVRISLAGPAHPLHQAKVLERSRRMMLAAALEGKEKAMERGLDEAQQARVELAIACVINWRGLANGDGHELPWSPQKAADVLMDKRNHWILEQISDALNDRDRFTKDSANA